MRDLHFQLGTHRALLLASIVVGVFGVVTSSLANPKSLLRRSSSDYVARIDAQQKWMFLPPTGKTIAWTQLGVVFAILIIYGLRPFDPLLVGAALVLIVPPVMVGWKVAARREKIDDQANGFALALSSALKATASIGDALRGATDVTAKPLHDELATVLRQMRVGSTLEEALLMLSTRVQSTALDVVVSALLIGRQTGGDLPRILENTAASLRELKRLERLTDKVTRSAKQSLAISATVTAALAIGLPHLFPGFFDPLRDTLKGQIYVAQMVLVYITALSRVPLHEEIDMTPPTYITLRWVMVGALSLSTGGGALWTASRPTRIASRLGMRGLKRQKALLEPFWSAIEPLVRWGGVRVSGIMSEKKRKELDLTLTHAGDYRGLTAEEYLGMMVMTSLFLATIGGLAAYMSSRFLMLVPLLALVGATIPHVIVDNARVARFRAVNRGLPYAIDLMALSMSAGLDFPGSVHQVVSKAKANEALREELGYMLQQIHLGRTRAQTLSELVTRVPIESVREFVHALLQAEERGTPIANALEIQASAARVRRANLAENAASDMRGKMVLPTMMIVGVSMMLIAVPSAMLIEKMTGGFR